MTVLINMRTIYVKKNFAFIITFVAVLIATVYSIDYYIIRENINIHDKNGTAREFIQIEGEAQRVFIMSPKNETSIHYNIEFSNKKYDGRNASNTQKIDKCSVTIALILCEDNQYLTVKRSNRSKNAENPPPVAKDFNRQLNQTLAMLKSISLQTWFDNLGTATGPTTPTESISSVSDCINVIILSDRKIHFNKIRDKIHSDWSAEFQKTLNLTYVPVKYPKGSGWMKKMFRPCATLRLFIPELLPKEFDSIVYLDTDFIFLQSVQALSRKYFDASKFQGKIAGMAPCLFHYGTNANKIPYYGTSGLNAGLMLMNLTRMRETLWTNKIRMVTAMFQHEIKLADQDILNIYFHFFPEELVPLTCDWNFRPFQCREGNYCEDPSLAGGISALHGNALSFTSQGPEPLFNTVFQAFHHLKLNQNFTLESFVENLETKLLRAEEALHSDCVRYGGFSVMVLNRLDKILRYLERYISETERSNFIDAQFKDLNYSEDLY